MRRLKVIRMPKGLLTQSMGYLENEKMIVTTHYTQEIRLWRLLSGKLECTLDVGMTECFYSFVMKGENAFGVVGWKQNIIKIVRLYGSLEVFGKNQCKLFLSCHEWKMRKICFVN